MAVDSNECAYQNGTRDSLGEYEPPIMFHGAIDY